MLQGLTWNDCLATPDSADKLTLYMVRELHSHGPSGVTWVTGLSGLQSTSLAESSQSRWTPPTLVVSGRLWGLLRTPTTVHVSFHSACCLAGETRASALTGRLKYGFYPRAKYGFYPRATTSLHSLWFLTFTCRHSSLHSNFITLSP